MASDKPPKISVIVPVYNAKGYLDRCIESILLQTFKDFEIVVVNDGSTDGSGKICDDYAQKDARIVVAHRENGGVSAARQFGIETARGVYSIHADSDDWMEPIALEKMYNAIQRDDSDCVICDFKVDSRDSEIYRSQIPSKLTSDAVVRDILTGILHGSTCNKLLRHSLYKERGAKFPKGINYCEDVLMWIDVFSGALKISHLPEAYYHYDQKKPDSITRSYTKSTLSQRLQFIDALQIKLPFGEFNTELLQAKLSVKHEAFSHGILSKSEYDGVFPEINKLDYLKLSGSTISKGIFLLGGSDFYFCALKLNKLVQSWKRRL